MIRALLKRLAPRNRLAERLYRRFGHPTGEQWAEVLRQRGQIYHIGKNCTILPSAVFTDPDYVWIGDRVNLGNCSLICHDGAIQMLYERHGLRVDRIGPIIIHDDVFIGEAAIVLGGTTIGQGSIVGAGSVLRQSVPGGSVVMGNPAKVVANVDDLIRFWKAESMALPWAHLIEQRSGSFDSKMEPELRRLRQVHFFKSKGL